MRGGRRLFGCRVKACDLRGGAALVTAGLTASGITVVEDAEYIKRGYENICRDLSQLGGRLRYMERDITHLAEKSSRQRKTGKRSKRDSRRYKGENIFQTTEKTADRRPCGAYSSGDHGCFYSLDRKASGGKTERKTDGGNVSSSSVQCCVCGFHAESNFSILL